MAASPSSSSSSSSVLKNAMAVVWALTIFMTCSSSFARKEAIDLSSKCPHLLTTATLKNYTAPRHNQSLLVAVPWKVGFQQFVNFNPDFCLLDGFSVQVFLQALRRMHPCPFQFEFVLHGDGIHTPSFDDMIDMVASGDIDAIVADLTITRDRMEKVGFTMPYLPSKLVMVTTFRYGSARTLWDFLMPFSGSLWVILLGSFLVTGVVLYFLEIKNPAFSMSTPQRKKHQTFNDVTRPSAQSLTSPSPSDCSRTAPSKPSSLEPEGFAVNDQDSHIHRIMNAYWFTSLCIFATQQQPMQTHLGRIVIVLWLFVMIIFTSSYTASLTSLLSAQNMYPTIERFEELLKDESITVGYPAGAFMKNYLQKIHIDSHRLRRFTSDRDYAPALRKGNQNPYGVGAVVDELPYIQMVLESACDLTINANDDHLPSFAGFGFAFRKKSPLIDEVSKMILELQEDGTLQVLQNGWRIGGTANKDRCNSSEESYHLRLRRFGGLFSILGSVYLFCIVWHLLSTKVVSIKKK